MMRSKWLKLRQTQGVFCTIYEYNQHYSNGFYRSKTVMFIQNVEEVKQGWWGFSSKYPGPFIPTICTLLLPEYRLVAEVTQYSPALLEYKIHNLSLTFDSRQNSQLNPQFIPSVQVETRHSYWFQLHAHYTIL